MVSTGCLQMGDLYSGEVLGPNLLIGKDVPTLQYLAVGFRSQTNHSF